MPTVTLYRLRPRGPMHFGARGIAVEGATPFPSAATVFSAWCWALRDLAGSAGLEEVLAGFVAGQPPWLLATPLPWIDDVLLLPRLPLPPVQASTSTAEPVHDKRGKRFRWVAEELWLRLAAGARDEAAFADDTAFFQGQTIWAPGAAAQRLRAVLDRQATTTYEPSAGNGAGDFWRLATQPHVTVDRHTGAGEIFHRGAVWFAPGVDLALPVVWRGAAAVRDLAERALLLLGEEGIGGERSSGHGRFDLVATETRQWPDLTGQTAFVTLAGYHPAPAEVRGGVFAEPARYDLELSRGWIERSTLRHAVRLVTAGSVLRALPGQSAYGGLATVTPDRFSAHPVYRYGYAFPLPVALIEEG